MKSSSHHKGTVSLPPSQLDEISTAKISSICDDSTIVLDSTVEARGATPTPIPTQGPWKPPPVVAKTNSGKVIPATTAWQREDSGLSLCLPFLCNDSTEVTGERLSGHTATVDCVAVLPGGRLISVGTDCNVKIWSRQQSGRRARFACTDSWQGHFCPIRAVAVLADGTIATGSDDKTIRLWDVASKQCIKIITPAHAEGISCLTAYDLSACTTTIPFTGDDLFKQLLLSGCVSMEDPSIKLWDLAKGECLAVGKGHTSCISAIQITRDGGIATASWDHTIRLWLAWRHSDGHFTLNCARVLTVFSAAVTSLAVLSNGLLVAGGMDNKIQVLDLTKYPTARTIDEQHDDEPTAAAGTGTAATSVGTATPVTGGDNSGACIRVLKGHRQSIYCLTVLGDGVTVVSGSHDNTLRIWDTETGKCVRSVEGHTKAVRSVATLADGMSFVSSSEDSNLLLWKPPRKPRASTVTVTKK